jgi:hypothetical protein
MNGGSTWSNADTIISTIFDCRDPSVKSLTNGSLLLNFFQSRYDSSGTIIGSLGVFITHSYDGGQTWFTPKMILLEDYDWSACSASVIELANGHLLLPVYAGRSGQPAVALCVISKDYGKTWSEKHIIAQDSTRHFQEPVFTRLSDGRILCVMRSNDPGHLQYRSYSADNGQSWSEPVGLSVQGQAADLVLTDDNILAVVYRDFSPNGTSLSFSFDLGVTFEKEKVLHIARGDRGYGDFATLKDKDWFACAYYHSSADKSLIYVSFLKINRIQSPGGLKVSVDNDSTFAIRWNHSPDAHYYRIIKTTSRTDSTSEIMNEALLAETYKNTIVDTLINSDLTYQYQVLAVSSQSELIENSGALSLPAKTEKISLRTK